jgi:CubicO group peptidase (beta-lactamase class C family)
MRTGIEWHETDRPLDRTNTTLQLEMSADWIAFTIAQPMDAAPGEKWAYNSGGSHLMSGVLKHATGVFADAFAKEHLFAPLGIRDFHWKKDPQGFPDTEGGLYLAAEDLAKIGHLVLHDGVWDGTRLLPEGWVAASCTRHAEAGGGRGYGYQWWRIDCGDVPVWAGLGFGGQVLLVIPSRRIVAVVNAWNVFDGRVRAVQAPMLDALLAASKR